MSREFFSAARGLVRRLAAVAATRHEPPEKTRSMADALFPDGGPALLLPTATRVDVGRWFRPARLWVAVGHGELVLFAPGPRPHCERIPLHALRGSLYNPVTGELVLKRSREPAPGRRVPGLRMPPLNGHRLLELIEGATDQTRS